MITKKQARSALITGLTAFSLSCHQAWAYDPGEQATEEGEILIFSEGALEAPGTELYIKEQNSNPRSQLLASDIHQDLTAFVEQNIGGIEEALLASESAKQGEALLAYNENSGEWEEVLFNALTETHALAKIARNELIPPVLLFAASVATLAGLSAPKFIPIRGHRLLIIFGAGGYLSYLVLRLVDWLVDYN